MRRWGEAPGGPILKRMRLGTKAFHVHPQTDAALGTKFVGANAPNRFGHYPSRIPPRNAPKSFKGAGWAGGFSITHHATQGF